MLWIAFAAQVSAAALASGHQTDVRTIFTAGDMPDRVQREGITRTVYTRTIVRPDGSTQSCGVEISSGNARLDAYTCALIVKRAKFVAAKWSDGSAVYGVIRVPVAWVAGARPSRNSIEGDLNLTVKQLPNELQKPHVERLIFGVEEDGHVAFCGADPDWHPGLDRSVPALAQVACDQLAKSYTPVAAKNDAGRITRSVQNATVSFEQ
jgi:TonB family protein